jgi:DNA-binding PadR family transcriptional regulator
MRILSELEGVAVGIITKHQPCTAYALRKELKDSPSSHWRGSAGAIYPLLERLEKEKLITTSADSSDGRGRRLLSVTTAGKQALRSWMRALNDNNRIAEVFDPLRTRVFFLDSLSRKEQLEFAEQTLSALESYLESTRIHLEDRPGNDLFGYLGARGGTLNAENRLEFIREVLHHLRKNNGGGGNRSG